MQLSIIIVNYNVKYFLEQCLCSVLGAGIDMEIEIFVVDNNSTDGSKDFFKGRFSKVKFIWLAENIGFGRANNIAFKQATGEHILFLNPDTILPEDSFKRCLSFLKSQRKAGAVGIPMIDGSGSFLKESKRAFPSPLTSLFRLSGLASLFPRSALFARYYLGNLDENISHEVDVLAGAFMMIRKSVLDQVGVFDEDFFMYGEDIDLSFRIQAAGFTNFYFAETSIIHFKGESTKKGSLHYTKLFYGAMGLFVKKHYSRGRGVLFNFLIDFAIGIKALIEGGSKRKGSSNDNEHRKAKPSPALIIGSKEEYEKLIRLIGKGHARHSIVGRISTGFLPEEEALGSLEQLPLLLATYGIKEIFFCTNNFPVKDVIPTIRKLGRGIDYWFHLAGTDSIVGSSNRNSAGEYIAEH